MISARKTLESLHPLHSLVWSNRHRQLEKLLAAAEQQLPTPLRRTEGSVGVFRSHDQASFLFYTQELESELPGSGGQRPAQQMTP
ncbi:UNVERIFIED_CONTAM: hypothetical protein FKN15_026092 [Acipenser sinensis]